MVRRPGDKTPDPPGGRAAERLRMFEEARGVTGAQRADTAPPTRGRKTTPTPKTKPAKKTKRSTKGGGNAKQSGCNA